MLQERTCGRIGRYLVLSDLLISSNPNESHDPPQSARPTQSLITTPIVAANLSYKTMMVLSPTNCKSTFYHDPLGYLSRVLSDCDLSSGIMKVLSPTNSKSPHNCAPLGH